MPYVLNAKVNICTNISDYYIEWQLLDHTRSVLETLADRGLELTIPSFTLRSGRQYCIKSNLINMENGKIITDNTKSITVRNNINNLIVKLPMISTTLNVQQPINIKPYIVDLDNNEEEMKTEWFCMYNHQNVCEGLKEDTLSVEGGFLKEGNYNVSIKVSKGSLTKSAFSIIKVKKDVPSIEIVTVQSPVAPSSGIYIKANIDDLRTFCILQWNSEGGPNFFDLESVPGNVNEAFEVFVKRDLFLRELEEFSNDVTNKEHDLIIPPPTGQWMGLPNIDRDYKLRFTLDAKCPKTQLQDSIEVEYSEDMFNDTLTVSAVVEIDVKSAPVLQTLYVERTEGIALETVFTFQTTEALETGTPKPFLYRFGYMLRDRRYIFCNVLDYFTCETILPYNDEGVETFLEVCDSFNSCGKIIGPTINTTLPNEINETDIWRIFKQKINTEDYHRAFGYALTVLYTSKALNGENKYNQHFSEEVVRKIDYLLKSPNKEKNWAKRANKIIRCIIEFNNELSFSEEVLNVLEQLRTELLKSQMKTTLFQQRKLLGMDTPTSEHLVNVDNFESYLQVSDLIISTSKNKDRVEMEKNNIVEKIREFVGKLCMQLYQSRKNVFLAFNSAILVIDELQKKSYGNFHVIPSNKNPWNVTAEIKFNINELEKMKYTRLCIAKIAYRNFFNTKGITYEAILLSADDGSAVMEKVKTTILLPLTEQSTGKLGKCLVYKNGWQTKCQTIRESKGYMLCTCLVMGRFYLDYDDLLTRSETNTIWSKSAENSTQHDEFTLHTYKVSTSISTPAHPIITTAVSVNDDAFSRPDLINSTKIDTPDKNYNFNSEESTSGSITQVTKDISDLDSTNKNYAITTNLDAENNLPTVEEDNISSMKSWSFLLKSGSNYSKFTEATTEMFNPAFLTNEYKTDDEDYSRKSSHETTAVFATTKNAMHDDVSVSTKSVNLIEDVNYSVSITEENDLWKQVHSTNKPTNYSQTGITSPSNIITPVTKNKNNGLQANLNLSINLSLNVTFV